MTKRHMCCDAVDYMVLPKQLSCRKEINDKRLACITMSSSAVYMRQDIALLKPWCTPDKTICQLCCNSLLIRACAF